MFISDDDARKSAHRQRRVVVFKIYQREVKWLLIHRLTFYWWRLTEYGSPCPHHGGGSRISRRLGLRMRDAYRLSESYLLPLSQDQARGLPLLLASLKTMADDSNLTSAILSCITPLQSHLSCPGLFCCHNTGTQASPERLMLDSLGLFTNYRCATSRFRSRLGCYWVAARAIEGLDKEIAVPQAVIKDVVDSCHSDTMYILKLRRPVRALASIVEFSVNLCQM